MTAYHDEDENLSVAKDPRDGPLTAVDRLRLYATDPDTFYFDAEAAEEVVALLDDLDRKTVGEVGVKPLVWEPDHVGGGLRAGEYRLRAGIWTHGYYWLRGEDDPHTGYTDEDEAKAAAQADYEARIRRALAPSPAIGRETVMVALDALKATEALDSRQCDDCQGEGEPEACGTCFPAADDARLLRRSAIAALEAALRSQP